jgi:quercetin dioxygenase-like cupin family protein
MADDPSDAYTFLADLRAEVEIPADGILSRTLFSDARLKAVIFGFDAGQELSAHAAAMPAVIHILEGQADVTLGDDRREAGPGSWIHMPAGLRHGLLARTPVVMLLLLMKDGVAGDQTV